MDNDTVFTHLTRALDSLVLAANCISNDETRFIADGNAEHLKRAQDCLEEIYTARDKINCVVDEQKRVAQ